ERTLDLGPQRTPAKRQPKLAEPPAFAADDQRPLLALDVAQPGDPDLQIFVGELQARPASGQRIAVERTPPGSREIAGEVVGLLERTPDRRALGRLELDHGHAGDDRQIPAQGLAGEDRSALVDLG